MTSLQQEPAVVDSDTGMYQQQQQQQNDDSDGNNDTSYDVSIVQQMLDACKEGNIILVQQIIQNYGTIYACQQLDSTGISPLMVSASSGHDNIVQYLLEYGTAPWNAIDRYGQCAGNYATDAEHWTIVNRLVDWGTRSELILGTIQRSIRNTINEVLTLNNNNNHNNHNNNNSTEEEDTKEQQQEDHNTDENNKDQEMRDEHDNNTNNNNNVPLQYQSSTKPDYLQQKLQYTDDGQSLLDQDNDAVMMEWERPIMHAHAQLLMEETTNTSTPSTATGEGSSEEQTTTPATTTPATTTPATTSSIAGKSVLNIGFGMGIIDTALQSYGPSLHVIIEPHPDVYQRMIKDQWHTKSNVRICYGTWQQMIPQLIAEGIQLDAIFYDTYGEHAMDMEEFHEQMVRILRRPYGRYSFFNGLAPDNIFFHGVACNVIQIQLRQLGLHGEFIPCEIQAPNTTVWEGIRRQYWYNRDTYYLPLFTWNPTYLELENNNTNNNTEESIRPPKAPLEPNPIDDIITQQFQDPVVLKRHQQQYNNNTSTTEMKRQRII